MYPEKAVICVNENSNGNSYARSWQQLLFAPEPRTPSQCTPAPPHPQHQHTDHRHNTTLSSLTSVESIDFDVYGNN